MPSSQPFKDYIVRYRKGDRIYSPGDPGTEMYIVQSGAVEIFKETDGRRVTISLMEKGDFFGEMALIESIPQSTCAEAQEDAELIEINSTLFDKMIKGNIEIAVRMLRKLSIRLRDATSRLEQMQGAAPMVAATIAPSAVPDAPAPVDPAPELTSALPPAEAPAPEPPATIRAPARPRAAAGTGPVPAVRPRPKDCHSYFLGEDGRELFHLVTPRSAIGRFDPVTGLKPEVDLSALDLNRSVSRHHARLTFEGGVHSVTEEVGALNGTFINGNKLVSGKPSRIKDGDVLNLGMVKLVFKEVQGDAS